MHTKTRKGNSSKNGDEIVDVILAASIQNGDDLGPIVRHAFEIDKPEVLLHQLNYVVKTKQVEIEELCKLHYEEFINAVDELRGVLVDTEELKSTLSSENICLQQVSLSLLVKLDDLLDSYSIKKNITETLKILKICVQVLKLCSKCNMHILNAQFQPTLKILDLIEKTYLQNIPMKAIRMAIEKNIPVIKSYIEMKVSAEFNDWLVDIRSTAKEIGRLALRQAAKAQQRDDEIRTRQREAEEQSQHGIGDYIYTLDIDLIDEDSVLAFDLTPVYRAYNIHNCLGIQDRFRSYYYDNRLSQLNLDMEISLKQSFLESHQPFFAQIAGHFVIEDRIMRTARGLLSSTQVEMMWDATVAKITSILEDRFFQMDTVSNILLVKDNIILLVTTLRQFAFRVSPLINIVDNMKDRYHELVLGEYTKQLTNVLINDTYQQMVITKYSDYKLYVSAFHLQLEDMPPVFPYIAQFSSSVPEVCRIVHSFIADSIRYLSYIRHVNLYDDVKMYLDRFLVDGLNEALLMTIHSRKLGVSQAMQCTVNISFLEHVCDLFFRHAGHHCGIPSQLIERTSVEAGLNAKNVLECLQSVAFGELLSLVNSKADEFLALTDNINWTANEVPQNENDYIQEVVIYLDSLFSAAQQILPMDALYKVGGSVLQHISDSIVLGFLSDSVKRFTFNCVIGIDNDLKILESFADRKFENTGLSDLKKECSLRDCLIESRQLINLLMSNKADDFMNPVIRKRDYGILEYKKVAMICDKFKDSPDTLFGSLSKNRNNAKQNVRKKSMDVLKRRLKDLN